MHVQDAIDTLEEKGKAITHKSLAKEVGIHEASVRHIEKTLALLFPEIDKAFNKDKK